MSFSLSNFEIAGVALGVREAVIALIVLVVVYMAIVLWRMRHLWIGSIKAASVDRVRRRRKRGESSEDASDASNNARERSTDAWRPPPGMAEDMVQSALEQELDQLRDEVDAMRGELAALREDMQHELGQIRASQSVSPIYGDAMQLAHAGYDPAAIAERCGIARAEAELVVALAKSQER